MYEKFIIAVLIISICLLVLLYYGYKTPAREINESEDDYMERLNEHECSYYGSRNLLLIILIFAGGAYVHRLTQKQRMVRGGGGGVIENMEASEPNLYKSEQIKESIVSDVSDDE